MSEQTQQNYIGDRTISPDIYRKINETRTKLLRAMISNFPGCYIPICTAEYGGVTEIKDCESLSSMPIKRLQDWDYKHNAELLRMDWKEFRAMYQKLEEEPKRELRKFIYSLKKMKLEEELRTLDRLERRPSRLSILICSN